MCLMINTNIEAYDAHRNLVNTENQLSKSMQRLSSGLRINSAADDAAGLAISQKLTGQVNGLDQAQRNAQDGVSLVQTAEGSLNQVHAMLQRIRELAVQYQNGTLATSDKSAIQSEVNQLQSEIARIGTTAQFNGIALFSGSATGSASRSAPTTASRSPSRRCRWARMVGAISLGSSHGARLARRDASTPCPRSGPRSVRSRTASSTRWTTSPPTRRTCPRRSAGSATWTWLLKW